MRTLNVSISDNEYKRYGIKNDTLTFADIVDIVNRKRLKQALEESIEYAEKCGLSSMTMDEIDEEIKSVRNAERMLVELLAD